MSTWGCGLSLVHHRLIVVVHVIALQLGSPRHLLPDPDPVQWGYALKQQCTMRVLHRNVHFGGTLGVHIGVHIMKWREQLIAR